MSYKVAVVRSGPARLLMNKLDGLGVRGIPAYSYPVYDTPRLDWKTGNIPINRIVSPGILKE